MRRRAAHRVTTLTSDGKRAATVAGTGTLGPAVGFWPDICNNFYSPDNWKTTLNTNSYYFHITRNAACVVETRGVETYLVPTSGPRELIGTAKFQLISWQLPQINGRTFETGLDISKTAATGVWAAGGEVAARANCFAYSGSCASQAGSTFFASTTTDLSGTWETSSPGSGIDSMTTNFKLDFRSDAQDTAWAAQSTSQPSDIRCDSLTYVGAASGCVVEYAVPWMTGYYSSMTGYYSSTDATHGLTATHIKNAQSTLPDAWALRAVAGVNVDNQVTFGSQGTPLTRMYNPTQRDANRAAACAGFVKTDADDSCDEFPFASTYEGAALITDPARRSVAHVPLADNSSAGSVLAAFLREKRVIDGDTYFITVDGPTNN
jgi:hypothetical protein